MIHPLRWILIALGAGLTIALIALGSFFYKTSSVQVPSSDQSAISDLNRVLEPVRREYNLPALAGAIVTSEKLLASGAVGVRAAGDSTPVTIDDKFHLGSCTKAMTATLLARLVEQGKLRWQTTLAEAFPDLAAQMLPVYRSVTVEMLLSHRGGFPGNGEPWLPGKNLGQMNQLPGNSIQEQRANYVQQALQQPPSGQPGEYRYSNLGYTVAGAIAERITGQSWEDSITQELFQPLGMTSAGFGAPGSSEQVDQPWAHLVRGGLRFPLPPGPQSDNPPLIGPAGRVHAAIGDWGKFIALHLAGEKGTARLLRSETIRKLHQPLANRRPKETYAMGWVVAQREWADGIALWHNGSNTLNYAVVWMAPKRDLAVLVATNQGNEQAEKATDAAVSALLKFYQENLSQPKK